MAEKELDSINIRPIRTLEDDFPEYRSRKDTEIGIREVDVSSIVGVTKINQPRFNHDWTPTERGADQRMLYVLEYVQKNGALPDDRNPVELVLINGNYYVDADGCRRVSAAHLFKLGKVVANVIEYK